LKKKDIQSAVAISANVPKNTDAQTEDHSSFNLICNSERPGFLKKFPLIAGNFLETIPLDF